MENFTTLPLLKSLLMPNLPLSDADRAFIGKEVEELQHAFTNTQFIAEIQLTGTDMFGKRFKGTLLVDSDCKEFQEFLRALAVRRSKQLL